MTISTTKKHNSLIMNDSILQYLYNLQYLYKLRNTDYTLFKSFRSWLKDLYFSAPFWLYQIYVVHLRCILLKSTTGKPAVIIVAGIFMPVHHSYMAVSYPHVGC